MELFRTVLLLVVSGPAIKPEKWRSIFYQRPSEKLSAISASRKEMWLFRLKAFGRLSRIAWFRIESTRFVELVDHAVTGKRSLRCVPRSRYVWLKRRKTMKFWREFNCLVAGADKRVYHYMLRYVMSSCEKSVSRGGLRCDFRKRRIFVTTDRTLFAFRFRRSL